MIGLLGPHHPPTLDDQQPLDRGRVVMAALAMIILALCFTPVPIGEILAKHPDRVIEKAVFGMLPKNSLAKQKLRTKLKVYAGADHPHAAQNPQSYVIAPTGAKVTA